MIKRKKITLHNSSLVSLFDFDFKEGIETVTIGSGTYTFCQGTIYNGRCLDSVKYKNANAGIETINFYIPTFILSKSEEARIGEYVKKFYNENEFYIFQFCGKVSGFKVFDNNGVYNNTEYTLNEYTEFYKFAIHLKDYEDRVAEIDTDNVLKKIHLNGQWSLINILALKASCIIRMYGNKNYESFEKLFDLMIKYFPFSDAISLASVIMFSMYAENLNTNFAIPAQPSFGHFNNDLEKLVIINKTNSTNPYYSYFTGYGIQTPDGNDICIESNKISAALQKTNSKNKWIAFLKGNDSSFESSTYFTSFIQEYKNYIKAVKEQNKIHFKNILADKKNNNEKK